MNVVVDQNFMFFGLHTIFENFRPLEELLSLDIRALNLFYFFQLKCLFAAYFWLSFLIPHSLLIHTPHPSMLTPHYVCTSHLLLLFQFSLLTSHYPFFIPHYFTATGPASTKQLTFWVTAAQVLSVYMLLCRNSYARNTSQWLIHIFKLRCRMWHVCCLGTVHFLLCNGYSQIY